MIRAGELRHQVRIEQRSTTQDAAGEPVNTWSLVVLRRAALERTPGTEVWASAGRNTRTPSVFRMRFEASVQPSMRLIFDGKLFDIISVVDPDGRKAEMLLTAAERVEEAP